MGIRTRIAMIMAVGLALSAGSAVALDHAGVDAVRNKALETVRKMGVAEGGKFLADPANGAIDLQGPGLHTWAMTRTGKVLFDNSGQTQVDMDISTLTVASGENFVQSVLKVVDKPEGGAIVDNSWPHPVNQVISESYMSCGWVEPTKREQLICAMAWIH
jgi:hypothetical protein